jgi:hypothetical protein
MEKVLPVTGNIDPFPLGNKIYTLVIQILKQDKIR